MFPPEGRDGLVWPARSFMTVFLQQLPAGGVPSCTIRGYAANSLEECIIASVTAEKDGAAGIICAPILASLLEKIVDIPVAIMKPKTATVMDALDVVARRIGI